MIFQYAFTSTSIPLINTLQQYGFVDLLIPFVLIFSVLFAILEKVHVFGTEKEAKKYNLVISIAIALLITIPHVLSPTQNDVVNVVNRFLPEFVFVTIALLILLMLLGLVGGSKTALSGFIVPIAAIIAVLYLGLIIINAMSPTSLPFRFLSDPNFQAIVIVLLVFGLIIYYIGRDEGASTWTWEDFFGGLFGKPPTTP